MTVCRRGKIRTVVCCIVRHNYCTLDSSNSYIWTVCVYIFKLGRVCWLVYLYFFVTVTLIVNSSLKWPIMYQVEC